MQDAFEHPLVQRYAGRDMLELFSPRRRFTTWRELWVALAAAEHDIGLPVSKQQVSQMKGALHEFDFDRAAELERELRHDVMAHVHHFGEKAPDAKGVIHLGATSCFVTDNADLILYRRALGLVESRLVQCARALAEFAARWRSEPCLGFTHYQVAQPTTVGKRATLWLQDLLLDLDEVRRVIEWLPARGLKGTTGTQASFLALCDGEDEKVRELDRRVCAAMGFERSIPVSGQTYTRKIDWTIHQALCGVAQSTAKFAADLRLLSHDGEMEEPSESKQIGSSAMPYKKNPMRCERVTSLCRYVLAAADTSAQTAANQWLERTLDDSAVRRIALPESFLAIDAILILCENVMRGMQVFPRVIGRRLDENLPFLAAEELLMAGVRAGGDRQDLHERFRIHSREAVRRIKEQGEANPLLSLIEGDEAFSRLEEPVRDLLDAKRFVGRAPAQVDEFLAEEFSPRMKGVAEDAASSEELRV
ncbi:MAG: adenylosuccinate lyase [Planctomycetota bacterium]